MKRDDLNRLINGIKSQVNIVEVAKKHMQLRGRGNRYWGLCPFHSERTPSFTVYADSGRFKCFGCGAHGDTIDLYGRLLGIDTRTAVMQLAAEYGVHADEQSLAAKSREIDGFLKKKRHHLRRLLQQWLIVLEDWERSLKNDEELDRYGDLYHEIDKLDCWLYNLEFADVAELRRMYEHIPCYLLGIYQQYWGGREYEHDG